MERRDFLFLDGSMTDYRDKMTALINEMKSQLSIIMTSNELLKLELIKRSDESFLSLCDNIENTALRLNGLTGDIYTRMAFQTDSLSLNLSLFDLRDMIAEVTVHAEKFIAQKSAKIVTGLNFKKPNVTADKAKLMRMLFILLANCAKNLDTGGEINLNAYDDGDTIYIKISDNGPKKADDIIFTEKELNEKHLTDEPNGSLKMSVAKILCLANGGEIAAVWADGRNIYEVTMPRLHQHKGNLLNDVSMDEANAEITARMEFLSAGF